MRWARRSTAGRVGTFGDLATLSFYPGPSHHDGRGRARSLTEDELLARIARLVPRLGSRLLLRRRREQHLRQAVQPAVRHAALRLRSQVRLFAHRLQPESYRHPSGHRLCATRASSIRLLPPAAATGSLCASCWLPTGIGSCCPRPRRTVNPPTSDLSSRFERDAGFSRNDLTSFLEAAKIETRNLFCGNLRTAAGLCGHRMSDRRRPAQHGLHHARHLLPWRVSGHHGDADRLYRRCVSGVSRAEVASPPHPPLS